MSKEDEEEKVEEEEEEEEEEVVEEKKEEERREHGVDRALNPGPTGVLRRSTELVRISWSRLYTWFTELTISISSSQLIEIINDQKF